MAFTQPGTSPSSGISKGHMSRGQAGKSALPEIIVVKQYATLSIGTDAIVHNAVINRIEILIYYMV